MLACDSVQTVTDSLHAGDNVCTLAQVLDHLLTLLGSASATATYNVDSCLAEVEDLLSYCNDILSTGDHHGAQVTVSRKGTVQATEQLSVLWAAVKPLLAFVTCVTSFAHYLLT